MSNQQLKTPGELIYNLTIARAAANGKPVKVATPAAPKDDLSHLPPIERLTAARKRMAKQKMPTNPAPTGPSGELILVDGVIVGFECYE